MKRDALAESNIALSKTVSEHNATVKKLEHGKHVDAKEYQTAAIKADEAHKVAIAQLCEEFSFEIEKAFIAADEETNIQLNADRARLLSERD